MCLYVCVVHILQHPLPCKTHTDVPTHFNDKRKHKARVSWLSNHLPKDVH